METDQIVSKYFARGHQPWATSPTVSIIVVSKDPEDLLDLRIAALGSRFDPARTEYVVAWAGSVRASGDLKRRFPHVHLISAPPSTSLADLRIQGIKAAAGDIVLLLQPEVSLELNLTDAEAPPRAEEMEEGGGSIKWGVALRGTRERARVLSS
jgi:hypothetical protein